MKKISILIITLLLATAAATAQTSSRWGITAGANFNEVHFKQSDIVPSKRAWGPQLGVTGEMNFSGVFTCISVIKLLCKELYKFF